MGSRCGPKWVVIVPNNVGQNKRENNFEILKGTQMGIKIDHFGWCSFEYVCQHRGRLRPGCDRRTFAGGFPRARPLYQRILYNTIRTELTGGL